jgi:hypothetical protein
VIKLSHIDKPPNCQDPQALHIYHFPNNPQVLH